MATARPWAYAVLGATTTACVACTAVRVYYIATQAAEPSRDLMQMALCTGLFLATVALGWRLTTDRRHVDTAAADVVAIRGGIDALVADIQRIDEHLEVVAARTIRIANIIEVEEAVSVGEHTGEILRLPKHRDNSVSPPTSPPRPGMRGT